jgi:hypothetical protein
MILPRIVTDYFRLLAAGARGGSSLFSADAFYSHPATRSRLQPSNHVGPTVT